MLLIRSLLAAQIKLMVLPHQAAATQLRKNHKVLKTLLFVFVLFLFSCTPEPMVETTENIEIALGSRYSTYVKMLNSAAKGDTIALNQFICSWDFSDGVVYDHGWVLIQLIEKVGDESYARSLKSLNKKELENVKGYIEAGIDMYVETDSLLHEHPKSFRILKLNDSMVW